MYGYGNYGIDYNISSTASSAATWMLVSLVAALIGAATWMLVSLVAALIGGIVVYLVFLNKSNEGKYKGFVGWLYDFLSFKSMFAEVLLKVVYLILAIYITLSSFALISASFIAFLAYLIIGNLILRLAFEFSLVILVICRNTTEINKKLKKESHKKEEK